MTPAQHEAFTAFQRDVERLYGPRLAGMFLFGSRARGDHRDDSDLDLAVVIEDGDWRFMSEKMTLVDLGFDALIDSGLYIQPWPIARSSWETPSLHYNPAFVRAIRKDARKLSDAT